MIFSSLSRRLFLVVLCCTAFAGCKRSEPPATPKAADAPSAKVAATPAGDWNKLRGRWLRPDGGYILEIRSVADDGRAEAAYFNPDPIHVAWARATHADGKLKLDAELRDVNYPGCLYKLTYVPDRDQLTGTYFQAQMQQTHEIFFVREQQ